MKLHGTATDKLADVIQMLQLVRKTGVLTVQRDSGVESSPEQGTIMFHDGQPIDASAGMLRGADAYKKLLTWMACHFVFQPSSSSPTPTPAPPGTAGNNGSTYGQGYRQEQPNERAVTAIIPYRLGGANGVLPDFQRLGLSRHHRQLFLLIDGRRSVQELMRLTGRQLNEISGILTDLASVGLIHL
jgi:Domain of unknown function (DUF4388)